MENRSRRPGSLTDIRLMELLLEYDEMERELHEPEPSLPSHSARLRDRGDEPLRHVDSLTEYYGYIHRRILDDARRQKQQRILETLVAEGLPLYLWVHAGEDRFVCLERSTPAPARSGHRPVAGSPKRKSHKTQETAADADTSEGEPEPATAPRREHGLRLHSVHRGALEAIPPVILPDLIVPISEEIDRVENTHPLLRKILSNYQKPLLVTIGALLFLWGGSATLFSGLQLGGVELSVIPAMLLAVLIGVSIVLLSLDRSTGPLRVRESKIALWDFYLDAGRNEAKAHYHKALSERHATARRLR